MIIGNTLTRYSPWRNGLMSNSGRGAVAVTRLTVVSLIVVIVTHLAHMAVAAHITANLIFRQVAGAMAVITRTRAV